MSAENALAKIEAEALERSYIAAFLAAVDEIRKMVAADDPAVRKAVLALVPPSIAPELLAAIGDATAAGARDALTIIGDTARAPGAPDYLTAAAFAADKAVADNIAAAHVLAGLADTPVETLVSPVLAAGNGVTRNVTSLVNAAGNAATTTIADDAGLPTVWVAETNACVHCLAYSGHVADPGEKFPGGLTYGAKSYHPSDLAHPPLHPHCRCTVEPLMSQEYADALRREADRSVLRGFSLESESMKVRIEAARRLLDSDVDAPKSVIAYARSAVKRGTFATRGRA